MSINTIPVSAADTISILAKTRLMWTRFSVQYTDPENGILQTIMTRFLDDRRSQGASPDRKEVILELTPEQEAVVGRLIDSNVDVDVSFTVDQQAFRFSTLVKDTAVFFDSVSVMILAWPGEMYLQPRRRADRTKSWLPEGLSESVYVRDISVFGCAFIWNHASTLCVGDRVSMTLEIPILSPTDPTMVVKHRVCVDVVVKRVTQYKQWPLYGCEFTQFRSALFFLIRQYCRIRKKEEAFYSKNQYYPKTMLPEIEVSLPAST